ncbi:sensor histidine kinase [Microbacterium sp. E-13]|uniref:sensor histidine kinase n=1 Tax=Microbacterium sp. E-13 TaxID=3404048 RepID=UPI003CFACD9C
MTNAKLTAAGWAAGVAVTAMVLWSPLVASGYRNPSLHLVLDTVDACVALLVAYLVYGRFRRAGRLQDLLLCVGLVLLATGGLGLSYIAGAVGGAASDGFEVWLPFAVRVFGGFLIAAAALVGDVSARQLVPHRPAAAVFGAAAFAVALGGVLLWSFGAELPLALDPGYVPTTDSTLIGAHPLLVAGQVVTAASFFVASLAFTAQATERDDELLRWLGPACAVGGFARLNYALFPSLYTDWLYTGDLLRTACYLLLLIGATREMKSYWSAQARAAVLDDRRRLARELHDGVVQELGYIRAESYALPAGSPNTARIIAACDRGLDEARSAVHALGHAEDEEPFGFTLHRAVREIAERYRVNLEVDLDDSLTADADQRHALLRIAREAVSNAVRHGKAERISVRLTRVEGESRLTVEDDGAGFDVDATIAAGSGYGLTSMRDRARGLPGALTVQSHPGRGSVVTVAW